MSFTGNAKTVNSGLPEMEEVRILMLFAFPVNEMITYTCSTVNEINYTTSCSTAGQFFLKYIVALVDVVDI